MLGIENQAEVFAREVGVKPDHFRAERELIDYALTGSVTAGKKLQVTNFIKFSVPVFMVNGFFGVKFSTEVLFHHVAMFKNVFLRRLSIHGGDAQLDVPVSGFLTRDFWKSVFFPVNFAYPFVFALLRTKYLFSVDRTAARPTSALKFVSAVFARSYVLFVARFASANSRTCHRTIEGVSVVLNAIRSGVRRSHCESSTAVFAGKFDFINASRWPSVDGLVRVHARSTAKLSIGFPFACDAKGLLAMFTNSLRNHVVAPLLGSEGTMAWISD